MRAVNLLPSGDRRAAPRVRIDLPIDIQTTSGSLQARTIDLSEHGLAVVLASPMVSAACGDRVSFSLPLQYVTPEGPTRLRGTAVVLRIESRDDRALLALKAESLVTTALAAKRWSEE